jgi:hypothetical protein
MEVDEFVFTQRMSDEGWTIVQDGAPMSDGDWNRERFFDGLTLGIPYHDMEPMPTVEEMLRRARPTMAGRRELDRHALPYITRDWRCLPFWFRRTLDQSYSVLVTGTVVRSPTGIDHVALFGPDVWFRTWLLPLNCALDRGHVHAFALTPMRGSSHALGVRHS